MHREASTQLLQEARGGSPEALARLYDHVGARIIISDATRARLKGRYDMKPLGTVTVKGRSEPVRIFEVRPMVSSQQGV